MNNKCDIVQDLLPLYIDNVCSPSSAELVNEHLQTCEDCSSVLEKLKNDTAESELKNERENVVKNQAKAFKRKNFTTGAAIAGLVIAGILAIPVLVCFIVNLASGHGLTWFFIVLASLMVAASLTAVPFLAPSNKGLWTIGTFTASLLTLFAVCCIYGGGNWFFVTATSVLFGLSVVFMPFVVKSEPMKKLLGDKKGLFVFGADTALFALMMITIGIHNRNFSGVWTVAASLLPLIIWCWAIFAIIRYVNFGGGFAKAGLCVAATGTMLFFGDILSSLFAGMSEPLPKLNLSVWNEITSYDNTMWLILIASLVIGAIFSAIGFIIKRKSGNNNEN